MDYPSHSVRTADPTPRYHLADFTMIPGVACPCGSARRAFAEVADFPGTLHVTEISADARTHWHREHTETYFVLECGDEARLELDGEDIPAHPGLAVVIPPGVRHRARGPMRVLIICVPAFDERDEWFDEND